MAGKEGLNLQFCNRVVLIEPDYNPSAEEQAIDRCHRIGQTRDVHVHKFYIKGEPAAKSWHSLYTSQCLHSTAFQILTGLRDAQVFGKIENCMSIT